MIDPNWAPGYQTSEYYQPGLMQSVGMSTLVIVALVALFLVAVIGARFLLGRSRRVNPTVRRLLRLIGGITKPAAPISFGRRFWRKRATRRKDEAYYRLQPAEALAGDAGNPAGVAVASFEPPSRRIRPPVDFSLPPENAWPFYAEDEIAAVVEVLESGKVNQWTGSRVFEFEQAYTRQLRNGRSIALANGTVALELALRALRIGPGDEVIVTPRSFVASASCVRLVGATPVFADVDRDSGNITAETIERAITPRTKAVIPVHLAGWPADMPSIMSLARSRDLLVIEDCAQAHGAEIDGLPVGSFGDAATFSFCQDKIISTGGEGGLASFRDDEAFEWAWSYKDHGKDRQRALERQTGSRFRWLHDQVGTNWRMGEVQAAIGLVQLDKLPGWRLRRQRNAERWAEALDPLQSVRVPMPARNINHAFYKFYVYIDADPTENERLRDAILDRAKAAGLRVFSGSCSEIYRERAFEDLAVAPFPIASELGRSSLMVEVHPTLDTRHLGDHADALAEIINVMLA